MRTPDLPGDILGVRKGEVMKAVQRRAASLAVTLFLALVVLAAGVQSAGAALVGGSGVGTVSSSAAGSVTTIWIIAGVAAAVLVIVGIALLTRARRRQPEALASVTSISPRAEVSAEQQWESSEDSRRKAA
jgi:hypothetical protein